MNPLLQYALNCADRGWRVFPLSPNTKIPLANSHWKEDATTDKDTISGWWNTENYNIGIATGVESNLTVIDVDYKGKDKSGIASMQIARSEALKQGIKWIPQTYTVQTPSGGYHLYFEYYKELLQTTGLLQYVDVRNDGGYVVGAYSSINNVIYSIHPDRDITVATLSELPVTLKKPTNHSIPLAPQVSGEPAWFATLMQGVGEGERDNSATRLVGYLHARRVDPSTILTILEPFAQRCSPPFPLTELQKKIDSITSRPVNSGLEMTPEVERVMLTSKQPPDEVLTVRLESTHQLITEWIHQSTGWFTAQDVDNQFLFRTISEKNNRRQILYRLVREGIIDKHPTQEGRYKVRDTDLVEMDFRNFAVEPPLDVEWPLGIHDFVHLMAGNLIVIAGSPNAGKTAMMLNLIRLNQDKGMPVYYWCSEMPIAELVFRMDLFAKQVGMSMDDWHFRAFERSRDFHEVIVPDAINIIDFLELTTEIHRVNEYLSNMTRVIGSGLVFCALQKKIGEALGRGQEFSLEKPRLYLSMDDGKVTIFKGKNWAKPHVNPNGLTRSFHIVGGTNFIPTSEWTYKTSGIPEENSQTDRSYYWQDK